MKLKGTKVQLRPIEQKDQEMIRSWRNLYSSAFFSGEQISKEQQRIWYDRYQTSGGKDTMFIVELLDCTPVGQIALYDVSVADRTARLGRVLLLVDHRGRGYMDEGVRLLTNYAFEKMKLFRIRVECFLDNTAAIAIYANAGYKTTTRPIIIMEKTNYDFDPKQSVAIGDLGLED